MWTHYRGLPLIGPPPLKRLHFLSRQISDACRDSKILNCPIQERSPFLQGHHIIISLQKGCTVLHKYVLYTKLYNINMNPPTNISFINIFIYLYILLWIYFYSLNANFCSFCWFKHFRTTKLSAQWRNKKQVSIHLSKRF